jgi:hypothetical protein
VLGEEVEANLGVFEEGPQDSAVLVAQVARVCIAEGV